MNVSFSRIKHHTITSTGDTLFTVPLTEDFTDGTWTPTDLVESEFGVKSSTKQLFIRLNDEIRQVVTTTSTGTTFSGLTVGGPINAVQFNDGSGLAGTSGFTFDQSNGDFKVVNTLGSLRIGNAIYGTIPLTGHSLSYNNPLSANTYFSGFITGDLRPYGDTDYSSSMGFRDTATSEAKTLSAYQDRIIVVSEDSVGDGFKIVLKDTEMTLSSTLSASTININRVIRGDDFHNSPAAQGSSTQQDIRSGTYTPSATSVTNIASSTTRKANWSRVGNIVNVAGSVNITPSGNGTTKLSLSLPIASNFGTVYEANGVFANNDHYGVITSDVTNNYVILEYTNSGGASAHEFKYTYSYEVI